MNKFYQLLRINHYIKNFLVFAPLLFTSKLSNNDDIFNSLYAFIVFCILASCVYILNDILDLDSDRIHPHKKKNKPLAAKIISINTAKIIFILLILILAILIFFNNKVMTASFIYLFLNFIYTIYLKKIPYIDIIALSSNYILRIYMGCAVLKVNLSIWMAATVFFSALFISTLKRRQELLLYGSRSREVLKRYSIKNLKRIINVSALITIIFYNLYVFSINEKLILTIPLVIYGVLRYMHRSEKENFSDSPVDEIIKDKQNILLILIWFLIIINS